MTASSEALHILIGSVEDQRTYLDDYRARRGGPPWWVPKSAAVGDDAVIFIGNAFLATARIASVPKPNGAGLYQALLKDVERIGPISIEEISAAAPGWRWPNYPRSYTTVTGDIAASVRDLTKRREDLPDVDLADEGGSEGALRLRSHLVRERKRSRVSAKKRKVLDKEGRLRCEVCDFDFEHFYGVIGKGFCEVHHRTPLAEVEGQVTTKLKDLAILCSNCHRMAHRKPMPTLDELRAMIIEAKRKSMQGGQ